MQKLGCAKKEKKKKPAHVFHQHLQICTAFIMIIKPNSQRDHALKRGNITCGSYYFYTAILTENAHCTVSSYTILRSVYVRIQ